MRTIESRRFVAGGQELRLFLVEEKGHRLPFRVRLKHATKNGVVAGFATVAEAVAALDGQSEKAVAAGWTQVPGQVRLALEIPAAPGSVAAAPAPACAHEAIQSWLPKLAPGKSAVCPDCGANVKP
jgi:hypothetical protein